MTETPRPALLRFRLGLGSLGLFCSLLAASAQAQSPAGGAAAPPAPEKRNSGAPEAGLLVAPTRLTFDARHRTASLMVMNSGSQAATYRISFVQMAMDEKGQVRELTPEEAALNPADQLVRYSPRQVYLEPGVSQTVRLQVRKPENLAQGEYRSHLLFRMLPNADPALPDQGTASGRGGLDIQLKILYGVAVPVIVRQGELWSKVALQPVGLVSPAGKDQPPALVVKLNRTGNESAYGDLTATLVESSGKEVPLCRMNGLAVYSPNPLRTVHMPLSPPPGVQLRSGRIRVAYAKPDHKNEFMATGYLSLPSGP
jgi:hypothetical protein